jgi:hypothetical protein
LFSPPQQGKNGSLWVAKHILRTEQRQIAEDNHLLSKRQDDFSSLCHTAWNTLKSKHETCSQLPVWQKDRRSPLAEQNLLSYRSKAFFAPYLLKTRKQRIG